MRARLAGFLLLLSLGTGAPALAQAPGPLDPNASPPTELAPLPPPLVAPLPPTDPSGAPVDPTAPIQPAPEVIAPAGPIPRPRSHPFIALDLLAGWQHFFSDSNGIAALDLEVGAETAKGGFAVAARFGFQLGAPASGLSHDHFQLGTVFLGKLSERVRLGVGPQLGVLVVNRVTHSELPYSISLGASAEVTIDLWRGQATPSWSTSSTQRVFLIGRGAFDWFEVNRDEGDGLLGTLVAGVGAQF